jgi:hypothetical protein
LEKRIDSKFGGTKGHTLEHRERSIDMRPTLGAIGDFNDAAAKTHGGLKSLKDVGDVLYSMAQGLTNMAQAIMQTYDKLEQIERKLSSASTHRRPTM